MWVGVEDQIHFFVFFLVFPGRKFLDLGELYTFSKMQGLWQSVDKYREEEGYNLYFVLRRNLQGAIVHHQNSCHATLAILAYAAFC